MAVLLLLGAKAAVAASPPGSTRFLFRQPNASAPPPIPQPSQPEAPLDQELAWRSLAMRDEHGRIPVGAIYLANLFRRQQLLNLPPVPPVGGLSIGRKTPHTASIVNTGSWTSRGPQNVGGRTRAFLIDPNTPSTMYAGAVSGGIWKSTDGGTTWQFQSNSMSNLAIMTMAFDPSVADRSVIYAGTGERGATAGQGPQLRADGIQGAGILKSTDHGVTWTQLPSTATWDIVPRIAVNANGVLLAAARHGIYFCNNSSCANGNSPWSLAFACYDSANGLGLVVAFDPNTATNAVAAVLDYDPVAATFRHKILYSTTAGQSWLPSTMPSDRALTSYYGDHIELAYAPSQSGLIYANASNNGDPNYGEIWRSSDGGQTFSRVPEVGATHCTNGACTLWVSPIDPNSLVMGGQGGMSRSTDGGSLITQIGYGGTLSGDVHADQHAIVASPAFSAGNPQVYVATDGGIFRTDDITTAAIGTQSWVSLNNAYQTAQYHGATGNSASGAFIGGTQDNGNLLTTSTSSNASLVYDGDGGLNAIDPTDATYRYGEYQFLNLFRARSGDPPNTVTFIARDGGPKQLTDADPDPYGSHHTAAFIGPFVLDAHDANKVVAGGLSLWRSINVKALVPDWDVIRPAGNNVLLSVAVARTNSDVIWVAEAGPPDGYFPNADGKIAKTSNGTAPAPSWTTVRTVSSADGLPPRAATSIYIDPDDASTVYVTFGAYDGHSLFRTTDNGQNWTAIHGTGLTALPPAPARVVVRHPRNSKVLFVGTDVGIYESDDGGGSWAPSSQGPGDAAVYDLKFVYGTDQLLVATHGRGLWTLETSTVATNAPMHLTAAASGTSAVSVNWVLTPERRLISCFEAAVAPHLRLLPPISPRIHTQTTLWQAARPIYTESKLSLRVARLTRAVLISRLRSFSRTTIAFPDRPFSPHTFSKFQTRRTWC